MDLCFKKIKKLLWNFGKYAFLFIIIFILLYIVLGEFLFYRYVFLANIKEPEITGSLTRFKENVYQSVLKELQDREDTFKSSSPKNYQDPFL